MYNFRRLYNKNSIVQFWMSYLFVLIIPIVIVFCGYQYVFGVVEKDTRLTNSMMLEHSVSLLDNDLKSLESMALQAAQSSKLRTIGEFTKYNAEYTLLAIDLMKDFNSLLRYQGTDIVEDAYIYLNKTGYVMYDSAIYRNSIFEKYIESWGMTAQEWRNLCKNGWSYTPRYVPSSNKTLHYVVPFGNSLKGAMLGSIVFRISSEELKHFLDFSSKYGNYGIFILNDNKEIIWADNSLDNKLLSILKKVQPDFKEIQGVQITSVTSDNTNWEYVLVLPEKEVLKQLTILKFIIFTLLIVAVVIGIICSLYQAIKAGRPINNIFKYIKGNDNIRRNSENLGELVQEVVKKNQRYMEELEKDKPLLQKAFFHDLIKAEIENTTELRYLAEKAGIHLEGKNYRIVTLKLFANNDFYDIDEQTIEEVRILMNIVMDYLEEITSDPIWFYKNNYLTTSIIFSGNDELKYVKEIVEKTSEWIYTKYSVDTRWGISNYSNDLLNIWKICEEAMTALKNADSENQIMEYQIHLENANEYYFPDVAEERLKASIQFGDMNRIENILNILQHENFEIRSLNRKRLIKFNTRIVQMLSAFSDLVPDFNEQVLWLNEIVIQYEEGMHETYFKRLMSICESLCQDISQKKNDQRGKLIKNIMSYINANYMDSNLGLAKISTEFGISEGYVSSMFKEQAGVNFADYVESIRIDKACQLLREEDITITDISDMVGYNSVQSFRRAFKRVKGIQPKEFRKE